VARGSAASPGWVVGREAGLPEGPRHGPAAGGALGKQQLPAQFCSGAPNQFAALCASDPTRPGNIYEKIETSGKICLQGLVRKRYVMRNWWSQISQI